MSAYERRDVNFSLILKIAGGLVAMFVIVQLTCMAFQALTRVRPPSADAARQELARSLPPEPRLQTDPSQDLAAMREQEDVRLHHYAWSDRAQGVVRIPVERAIDLLAQRGLPARREKP